MSGSPGQADGASDFSRRLRDALAKAKTGTPASAAAGEAVAGPTAPQSAQDAFNDRLAVALRKAQGQPDAATENDGAVDQRETVEEESQPIGEGDYRVRDGDCMTSIANKHGFYWETLWTDPSNRELKDARKNPNVLLPDDRVTIREMIRKDEPIAAEQRHTFVRRGEPAKLHVRICEDGEPIMNQPYELRVDDEVYSGTTDADGNVMLSIPGSARRGRLLVGPEGQQIEYRLDLGHLSPIEDLAGVQERLNNLGFDCDGTEGKWNARTEAALYRFQEENGLEITGKPDEPTRNKLLEVHGS